MSEQMVLELGRQAGLQFAWRSWRAVQNGIDLLHPHGVGNHVAGVRTAQGHGQRAGRGHHGDEFFPEGILAGEVVGRSRHRAVGALLGQDLGGIARGPGAAVAADAALRPERAAALDQDLLVAALGQEGPSLFLDPPSGPAGATTVS